MHLRNLSLSLGLIIGLFGTSSGLAGVFKANRLFVASSVGSRIDMFDQGTVAGAPLGGALSYPVDLTFGPDGLLYVIASSANEIVQIDSAGTVVNSFGSSFIDAAGLMAFGADGRLYVVSTNNTKVLIFNTSGVKLGEFSTGADMAWPVGIDIGPDGHIYLGDWLSGVIDEYDPSGQHLREFGTNLDSPAGMTFGPNGRLYVTSQGRDSIKVLDETGTEVDEIGFNTTLSFPLTCVFGPDGHLWVSCQATDEVLAFDLAGNLVNGIPPGAGLDHPAGLAFAPFHFKAKVSGRLALGGRKTRRISEKVDLYVAPGSQLVMLEIDSLPPPSLSEFGTQFYVLHGFEGFKTVTSKRRILTGRQQYMHGFRNGSASISLEVNGKLSNAGLFTPQQGHGSFQREAHNGVFNGKIVTTKSVK